MGDVSLERVLFFVIACCCGVATVCACDVFLPYLMLQSVNLFISVAFGMTPCICSSSSGKVFFNNPFENLFPFHL